MVQIIDHIDTIVRFKCQDLVYVSFFKGDQYQTSFDYLNCTAREELLKTLNEYGVPWGICLPPWFPGLIEMSYSGWIYIDLPYESRGGPNVKIWQLVEFIEKQAFYEQCSFWHLRLELAMENTFIDDPEEQQKWF